MPNSSALQQQTSQNQQLVDALREERSAVWSMYCEIADLKPHFANCEKVRPVLSRFTQLLVDYISLGHFGIYEHLLTEKQQQMSVLSYANSIYPAFSNTTAKAMRFNDAYEETRRTFNADSLATDLSALGEHLATRMELEDKLCSILLH
jgi:regulator of sigma D